MKKTAWLFVAIVVAILVGVAGYSIGKHDQVPNLVAKAPAVIQQPGAMPPPTQTVALPGFAPDEEYASVRQKLLAAGWQPFHATDADICNEGDTRCQGRPEMQACGGGAMANCLFLWQKDGATFAVRTMGDDANLMTIERVSVPVAAPSNYANNTIPSKPESQHPVFIGYWECTGITGDVVRSLYFGEDGKYGSYVKSKAGDEAYFVGGWAHVGERIRTATSYSKAIAFGPQNMSGPQASTLLNRWLQRGNGWNEQAIEIENSDRIRVIGAAWYDGDQVRPLTTKQSCQRLPSNSYSIQFP